MQSKILEFKSTDPRVSVGRYTYGNPKLLLWAESERINIGSFCSIAEDVVIFGGGEHCSDWATTFPLRIAFGHPQAENDGHPRTKGVTTIGNDVWLGYRSMIISGVSIGDGVIVGAGAVVASDIPAYAIAVGNPAKIIKYRFSQDKILELQKLQWWNWPIEIIQKYTPALCSTDFIEKLKLGI